MQNGIYSKNCITDFPSTTFPCHASLITGTYTGDYRNELCHGIPLGNWIGRDTSPPHIRCYAANDLQIYKLNEDLGQNCQTILEMIDEGNKTSIGQFLNRGTDYFFPESKLKLIYYYLLIKYSAKPFKMATRANGLLVKKLIKNFSKPRKLFDNRDPPICSLLWFMSSDVLMHLYGSESRFYIFNLVHIDKAIGTLINSLEKMGYLDDTVIALTSDHGNYKAHKRGVLQNFFDTYGLTHYHPRRNINGNFNLSEFAGIGSFNFKGTSNISEKNIWNHPKISELSKFGSKEVDLFKILFKIDGTSLMYYRDDDNSINKGIIHIKSKERNSKKIKNAYIEYKGSGINLKTKYCSDNNIDIFQYSTDLKASKILDGKFHDINEWMELTNHVNYPIYPDMMVRHFKNPRSSDIILSTLGNVVYNYQQGKRKHNHIHTHDIGLRNSMIVPLIIGGSPDIPQKEIDYCKITDIVPTLLAMINKKPHKSVLGNNLI